MAHSYQQQSDLLSYLGEPNREDKGHGIIYMLSSPPYLDTHTSTHHYTPPHTAGNLVVSVINRSSWPPATLNTGPCISALHLICLPLTFQGRPASGQRDDIRAAESARRRAFDQHRHTDFIRPLTAFTYGPLEQEIWHGPVQR